MDKKIKIKKINTTLNYFFIKKNQSYVPKKNYFYIYIYYYHICESCDSTLKY